MTPLSTPVLEADKEQEVMERIVHGICSGTPDGKHKWDRGETMRGGSYMGIKRTDLCKHCAAYRDVTGWIDRSRALGRDVWNDPY